MKNRRPSEFHCYRKSGKELNRCRPFSRNPSSSSIYVNELPCLSSCLCAETGAEKYFRCQCRINGQYEVKESIINGQAGKKLDITTDCRTIFFFCGTVLFILPETGVRYCAKD